jgi:hypothetical protein
MSAKTVFPAALVLTVLCLGLAQGQTQSAQDSVPQDNTAAPSDTPGGKTPPTPEPPHSLSPYITYQCPECCGHLGCHGPIMTEIEARAGFAIPLGGSTFSNTLQTGWQAALVGRSMLFNSDMDGAWALEVGLNNIWNHGKNPNITFPIFTPSGTSVAGGPPTINVSTKSLNRTFVNFGLGREWYLTVPATAEGNKWRFGLDVGGRYGSAKLDMQELTTNVLQHRTKVFEGVYVALHGDAEIPCCSVVFIAGFRAEWAYTGSDILQTQNNADLFEVDLLLTAGVRF